MFMFAIEADTDGLGLQLRRCRRWWGHPWHTSSSTGGSQADDALAELEHRWNEGQGDGRAHHVVAPGLGGRPDPNKQLPRLVQLPCEIYVLNMKHT